ncbi:MAG TPA: [protein-PII] uridylyltransferase [Vicinamibacteria bacterium]|nr:[protein-PII] uridylyltransferase [Vicinamibacteria bacterium]
MTLDRQTIHAHAEDRLQEASAAEHGRRVSAFRRFLKLETDRLRMRQRMGLGGREVAAARAYQVDEVVTRACRLAADAAGAPASSELARCAVVGLGGYGRAELAPFSDVDLLFLHRGRPTAAVAPFVEQVLMLLWDAGLTVGHAFRSVRESMAMAREDLHSRTALTEARLVAGSTELFQELLVALDELRSDRRSREWFLDSMRREYQERQARHGDAVCVQEPNVKDGKGGLRELHTVLWVADARLGARGLSGLEAGGFVSEQQARSARRAYDFLLRVRNEAHFASGRKSDLLTLDLQNEVARGLGAPSRDGLLSSEVLMREYYRRASELAEFARGFVMRDRQPLPPRPTVGFRVRPPAPGLAVREGRLHAAGGLHGGGAALLTVFATAQAEGVPLSDELLAAVRERLPLVDRAARRDPAAATAFLDVLRWRGRVAPALRAMHEAGFLGRYLPEFGRVTFLVQHDFFHRYTVDEHTLRAIEALDEVAAGTEPAVRGFGGVLDEVEDAMPVYLALLLHDIGKGRGGGHVARGAALVPRVCERLRLGEAAAEDVAFLVSAHLEMSQISQQRDLSEPRLLASFAARVGRLDRLDQLLLLTYADHKGVGPGVWNEWKAALLWELYDRTRERLAGHPIAEMPGQDARARTVGRLLKSFSRAEVEHHFSLMPERYLRSATAERMEREFRLAAGRGAAAAALEWRDLGQEHCTELTVVAADRPGLFARLAGTLTANGVDILSVDLFSRRDGLAIDAFRVSEVSGHRPLRPERRERAARQLLEAIDGRLDVAAAVESWRARGARRAQKPWGRAARPPSVRFDHEASATATVIEVRAPDRPGLAWTVADALAALGLDISFAKVATAQALALDVFYVMDERGGKLEADSLPRVEAALLSALGRAGDRPAAAEAP